MEAKEFLYKIIHSPFTISTDTRSINNGDIFVALKGQYFDANEFIEKAMESGALWIICENQNYIRQPKVIVVADSLRFLQDLAFAYRQYINCKVIAITGSNGKTTTKELCERVIAQKFITHATKGNYNNHIGVPLTILSAPLKTEVMIVEMGANHQGEINRLCEIADPDLGIITNIGKAHLEGFGGEEGVLKGKTELYRYISKKSGVIIYNPLDKKIANNLPEETTNIPYIEVEMISTEPEITLKLDTIHIKSVLFGKYNIINIQCAISLGLYLGVSRKKMKIAIESYVPKNNRSEIGEYRGAKVILDAYNANPSSMIASIQSLIQYANPQEIILIIGDMLELGDYEIDEHIKILRFIENYPFSKVYLVGPIFNKVSNMLGTYIESFVDNDQIKTELQLLDIKGKLIFLKGSRGLQLEKIIS